MTRSSQSITDKRGVYQYADPARKFLFRIENPKEGLIHAVLEGQADLMAAQETQLIIEQFLVDVKGPCFGLVDLSRFERINWRSKIFFQKLAKRLFEDKKLSHLACISPNQLIRVMFRLTARIYPQIKFSLHKTEEEAREFLDQLIERRNRFSKDLEIKDLQGTDHIMVGNTKLPVLQKDEWIIKSEDGKFTFQFLLINEEVVLYRNEGVSQFTDYSNQIESAYQDIISLLDNRKFMISDFSGTKGIPLSTRKTMEKVFLRNRQDWIIRIHIFPPLIRSMFKAYSLINPWIKKNTVIFDSLQEGFEYYLDHYLFQSPPIQPVQASQEELPDPLDDVKIFQEFQDFVELHKKRSNQLFQILWNISWDQNFKPKKLPELPEEDPFGELFSATNILQDDIYELIQDFRQFNQRLEQKVKERTREISQNESNLRAILDNTFAAVALIDNKSQLIDFNQNFADQFQHFFSTRLRPGIKLRGIFKNQYHNAIWKRRYLSTLRGFSGIHNDTFLHHDIEQIFQFRSFPIRRRGRISGMSLFAINITSQKQSEITLKNQYAQVKKLNEELDRFVYSTSHDLRAPLSSILGLANLGLVEENPDLKDQYFDLIKVSVNKLDRFIKDIIDYSRNARIDIRSELIDFQTMIQDIFGNLSYLDPEQKVSKLIELEKSLPDFYSDPIRLQTIIANLISNSMNYRRNISDPFIKVEVNHQAKQTLIEVSDNGQGIRPESQDRIFEMFFRGNESSRGSGLGLYIVKETVDKLQGTITMKSELDAGTTFRIELPNQLVEEEEVIEVEG